MDSHILTANRLSDGRVVVRAADGWSLRPEDALRLPLAEVESLPPLATPTVVGARAVAVDDHGLPLLLRERIRLFGPTVRFGAATREA